MSRMIRAHELARAVLDGSARPEEVRELARLVLSGEDESPAWVRQVDSRWLFIDPELHACAQRRMSAAETIGALAASRAERRRQDVLRAMQEGPAIFAGDFRLPGMGPMVLHAVGRVAPDGPRDEPEDERLRAATRSQHERPTAHGGEASPYDGWGEEDGDHG